MGLTCFPLLQHASLYDPNTFKYQNVAINGKPVLKDWIEVFRNSIPSFIKQALQDTTVPVELRETKAGQFAEDFNAILDELLRPDWPQPVNCISLCAARDACLQRIGFGDIFKVVKDKENAAALQLLPEILRELDSIDSSRARWELAIRGVFAGAIASAERYEAGDASFAAARAKLCARPWAIDDLDKLLDRLDTAPAYRKAILFVDNAGSDILLGMLPFARELLKMGTTVLLAANETPTINDITVHELQPLIKAASKYDDVIRVASEKGALHVISSGNPLPVIDLRQVSQELHDEALDADLVVLEGMGRAIETNLHATFTCDSLKLGMIKHPEVAAMLDGRLYDCVCKFSPAS